jgi:hypothetical protein
MSLKTALKQEETENETRKKKDCPVRMRLPIHHSNGEADRFPSLALVPCLRFLCLLLLKLEMLPLV